MPLLDALPSLATLYAIGFVAVLAHEYGHAYAAARFGGRVESLNIGFGPALFSCAISAGRLSTRVYIRLLLIGGYVAIDEKSVATLPRTKRIVILLGGVLMNAAMAILAFAWLSYYPKVVEPLQHVVQALPAKYTGGKALLPDGEQYILRSLKQSEAKTEWEFEPLTLSSQDSKVMVLPKACGGDCDSLLRRDLGIELSQAFRGEPDSGSGKTGFVVLSLNGNRFGNRYAFHDFLGAAARDNTVLYVEAICGNHFCNGSYGARELLAYRWHSTPVRDHQVVSETWPLIGLPWVLIQEVLRSSHDGAKVLLEATGLAGDEPWKYEGTFTRLAKIYSTQGVSLEGWAVWAFVVNVGMIVFNLIPFFGSDGYRVIQTIAHGRTRRNVIVQRAILMASVGLIVFFSLGLAGGYIVLWEMLTSAFSI